jgi:hypothetical protein
MSKQILELGLVVELEEQDFLLESRHPLPIEDPFRKASMLLRLVCGESIHNRNRGYQEPPPSRQDPKLLDNSLYWLL